MKDLISIIVPVYKAEKFLSDTINTVEKQTYGNWELIFVDDCSPDNSSKIIENAINKDKRIKIIKLKQNSGAAIARNEGIKNAKGNFIAFLDADDLWEREKLERQINFMLENEYEFSFTGYEFADENGAGRDKVVKVPSIINYKQALKNTIIWTSTVMLNVEKLDKKLIKMPNIKSEDTAMWWNILKNGYIAHGLNQKLSYYRRTRHTLSSNKLEAIKRIWQLYRKQEKLNIIYSFYNLCFWAINAIKKRV